MRTCAFHELDAFHFHDLKLVVYGTAAPNRMVLA